MDLQVSRPVIFIARHAETDQGAARVVQVPEAQLSARGRDQAARLAERASTLGIVRILASDLVRAAETAGIVAARLALPVSHDALLRERDFGDLRGLAYTALPADPYAANYVPPNGESWAVFHARVARAWERVTQVAAETKGHLLVVTHGLLCHALATRHWDCPGGVTLHAWVNTSLSEIEPAPPWKAVRMNCSAHLTE